MQMPTSFLDSLIFWFSSVMEKAPRKSKEEKKKPRKGKEETKCQFPFDGKKTCKIDPHHLQTTKEGPVAELHIFLFDRSGSMAGVRIDRAKTFATVMYQHIVRRNMVRNEKTKAADKVWDLYGVAAFNTSVDSVVRVNQVNRNGKQGNRFQKQLAARIDIEGRTALFDSIAHEVKECAKLCDAIKLATGIGIHAKLVVLSDEEDNASHLDAEATMRSLQAELQRVNVSIVHIADTESPKLREVFGNAYYCVPQTDAQAGFQKLLCAY